MRNTTRRAGWVGALFTLTFVAGITPAAPAVPKPPDPATRARILESYGQLPLVFAESRGQAGERVRYLARGRGYGLLLTSTEAVLALRAPDGARTLHLRWAGARPARMAGEGRLAAEAHDFRGSGPSRWRHMPLFERVRYAGLYPGVDLVFYGRERQLEYDLVLAPGADPGAIRLAVEGADRLEMDPAGDLVLTMGGSELRLRRPVSYQEVAGVRRKVASDFHLLPSIGGASRLVGFELGAYDPSLPLVIDPVLVYSTYLGGRVGDEAYGIAVDAAGNAYVTGATYVSFFLGPNDFPVTPGALKSESVTLDAFVTKLDGAGALVYSTILGGDSAEDVGSGIAVDAAGNAYVTGFTASFDFPLLHALQPPPRDFAPQAFVVKLSPSGSLLYSTTLGGSNGDFGSGIAIDAAGAVYITGSTGSGDFPQPGFPPLPAVARPSNDVFVAKLAPGGAVLVYSRIFGGDHVQSGRSIAVDSAGSAHVTGVTGSALFPVVNAAQAIFGGDYDAFALRLDPSGSELIYSTFLGGASTDTTETYASLALDMAGNAYVTGVTLSADFPTANALQPVNRGSRDGFVTKLSRTGTLIYSTYLGGTADDQAMAIVADSVGGVFVTGGSLSPDFPLVDPLEAGCARSGPSGQPTADVFVTRLAPDGSSILFSTCLGGSSGEGATAIARHPAGDLFITGSTSSPDFPTVDAFQPTFGGGTDGFVLRIAAGLPPACGSAVARPNELWPPSGRLVPIAITGVTDPEGNAVTITVSGIRQDEPLAGGAADASGIGTSTPLVRATRAGTGDGRTYHVSFTATDEDGSSCTGAVTICAPHDRGRSRTCGDGGALFDSTGTGGVR